MKLSFSKENKVADSFSEQMRPYWDASREIENLNHFSSDSQNVQLFPPNNQSNVNSNDLSKTRAKKETNEDLYKCQGGISGKKDNSLRINDDSRWKRAPKCLFFRKGRKHIKQITFKFEFHALVGEDIRDNELMPPAYGLLGPDIVIPILSKKTFSIRCNHSTTIGEVNTWILEFLEQGLPNNHFPGNYSFLVNGVVYQLEKNINDRKKPCFDRLCRRWLDPHKSHIVHVVGWINCSAGEVHRSNKLRYFFHSHENGRHNNPHIHVETLNREKAASISLKDGRVLEGNMRGSLLREAQSFVLQNQKMLVDGWNAQTDGLIMNLNAFRKGG